MPVTSDIKDFAFDIGYAEVAITSAAIYEPFKLNPRCGIVFNTFLNSGRPPTYNKPYSTGNKGKDGNLYSWVRCVSGSMPTEFEEAESKVSGGIGGGKAKNILELSRRRETVESCRRRNRGGAGVSRRLLMTKLNLLRGSESRILWRKKWLNFFLKTSRWARPSAPAAAR